MSILRTNINGKDLIIEKRALAPNVFAFYICLSTDPKTFPMVYSKDTQNWIFVDKMTFVELIEMESEISDSIRNWEHV